MSRALAALMVALMLMMAAETAAPAAGFSGLAFHPHPGARLPLDRQLFDERGHRVALGRYFAAKPVFLVLEYSRCKSFCGLTLRSLATALDRMPIDAGRDYQVVAVSIDPSDTPDDVTAEKARYLALYHHRDGSAGWHFLSGPRTSVQPIAEAIGFPDRYDAAIDQYIHPVGFVAASPNGTISRYLLEAAPTSRELREALDAAGRADAAGPLTRFLLWCHGDNPQLGRSSVPIEAAFAIANIAAMMMLAAIFIAILRRRRG